MVTAPGPGRHVVIEPLFGHCEALSTRRSQCYIKLVGPADSDAGSSRTWRRVKPYLPPGES